MCTYLFRGATIHIDHRQLMFLLSSFDFLGQGEVAITLHVLGLLADILGAFPQNSLKATCETILRVMTLANVVSKLQIKQVRYILEVNNHY